MTRDQIKNKLIDIMEDIEPYAHDDSGLYIPLEELEKAAEKIMELWDMGFTYEV